MKKKLLVLALSAVFALNSLGTSFVRAADSVDEVSGIAEVVNANEGEKLVGAGEFPYTITFKDTEGNILHTASVNAGDLSEYGSVSIGLSIPTIPDGKAFGGWYANGMSAYTYVYGGSHWVSLYPTSSMDVELHLVDEAYFIDEAAGGVVEFTDTTKVKYQKNEE